MSAALPYRGGRVPFGWGLESGVLFRNELEQSAIRTMRRLREAGKSYREIAFALASFNFPAMTIKRILDRTVA